MKKILNKILKEQSGQSLIEILIALTIGSILIGAASTAVVTVLQSGNTSQRHQSATALAEDYVEKARSFASSKWNNLYSLNKTSSTLYHFDISTSSQTIAVEGEEGVIDNDIRGSLAGYWSLDEASSTIVHDKSGNGNNGTINGASATSTDNCRIGRCLYFNDDSVSVSHDSTLDFDNSDDFTMSLWAKKTEDPGSGNVVGLFGKVSGNNRFGIDYYFGGNQIRAGIRNNTDGTKIVTHSPSDNLTNWKYITFVYESEQSDGIRMYIDGDLVGTSTSVGLSNFGSSASLTFGADFALGGTPVNYIGYVDDVRIYNRALDSGDINHLYDSEVFTRYFYVEDVCRTNDSDYSVAGTKPCQAGQVEDPSTQKITVVIEWGENGEFVLEDYFTRWRNETYSQTDWSGGGGFDGVVTDPTNQYSSSSNIATSTGSIKLEGIN